LHMMAPQHGTSLLDVKRVAVIADVDHIGHGRCLRRIAVGSLKMPFLRGGPFHIEARLQKSHGSLAEGIESASPVIQSIVFQPKRNIQIPPECDIVFALPFLTEFQAQTMNIVVRSGIETVDTIEHPHQSLLRGESAERLMIPVKEVEQIKRTVGGAATSCEVIHRLNNQSTVHQNP